MSDVILVDQQDRQLGTAEKMEAHRRALLHRAFSVFIWRQECGELQLLVQQRALDKYHCGGLWANTCCSHPRPGQDILQAAQQRLQEETGLHCANLHELFTFIYRAGFANGLTEYEFDHVLCGQWQGDTPQPDSQEIAALKWIEASVLQRQLKTQPKVFAPWFRICAPRVIAQLQEKAIPTTEDYI